MILSPASTLFVVFGFLTCVLCASLRVNDVDPSLIPPFGVEPGVNPDGTGNCDGVLGTSQIVYLTSIAHSSLQVLMVSLS